MNKIICYINDNYIEIKKNNIIYKFKLDSIQNGDIINSLNFINTIKRKKIFSSIISYKVDLYLNKYINEKDIFYYKNIFDELNVININILSTSNLLNNNDLIVCESNYILYFNNKYYYIDKYLLNLYIKYFKIDKLKVYNSKKINNINTKVYYYNNNIIT